MKALGQLLRFSAIGLAATAIQYAILVLLVQAAITDPVSASSLGFAVSAAANYALNRRFTFHSTRPHAEALPRFAAVAATGLVVNAGLVSIFHIAVGLHYLAAQVLATLGTLLWNYSLNRSWTFSPPAGRRQTP